MLSLKLLRFTTAALLILSPLVFPDSGVLPTAAQTAPDRTEAKRLFDLGVQQFETSQFEAAARSFEQVLAIARQTSDREVEGKALNALGATYSSMGDYSKAIELYQQALTIARETKDRDGESAALGNLGIASDISGDYSNAIQYYQQALTIAREIKDRKRETETLGNLGILYFSLGDYLKSIDYHQQRLVIAREIKDRNGEAASLGNLGNDYDALGDPLKAIEYHQQHLVIARELKDRQGESIALGNLGLAYNSLGDYLKAIDYEQQSLAISHEISDRNGEARTLGNLGFLHQRLRNYSKAVDYYQKSLLLASEIKDRLRLGVILNNFGSILLDEGRAAEAEAPLRAAIQIAETLRQRLQDTDKVSLADTQRNPYTNLQLALIAQNKPEQALEIAERGRARAFAELLSKRQNRQSANLQPIVKPSTIAEIRQIAKAHNATLVQYSVINDQSLYIWVVQPTGEIAFRSVALKSILPSGGSLAEYVRAVRSDAIGVRGLRARPNAGAPRPAQKSDSLKALHHLLIEPIAALLPTDPNQRVIFLPQDSLFLVPFAALQDANGKYLVEQHTILTAPSIQVLQLTQQQKQPGSTTQPALIVGNPTMPAVAIDPGEPTEQLPELPGAEAEAKAIAQFLKVPVLTGDQATETRVKQQMTQARLIHLATHGLLDDRRGIGSAIALAPSRTDNGLLTAEEILDLRLTADLVVLSACDTGRGKITGDGVIGLSRSLISAGTPSVLVSLWAVPDAPTAFLMQAFYRNLQQNSDKAQALRQAMLTTMQQTPAPRDWAAFTLIGEP